MNPKELHFDKQGREKLLEGITKMSKTVKSTLGPLGPARSDSGQGL